MPAPDPRPPQRLGLVIHPSRALDRALETLNAWTAARDVDVVQIPVAGRAREVAPPGAAAECDLVLALGGDGTTLAALREAAAVDRPVLGVACGSLGALTAVAAPELAHALDRVAAGDWRGRRLPGAAVSADGAAPVVALNDLVVVRAGAGQVAAAVRVDGELYARFSGDGLVIATPLGSSAYTLAAGGPVLAPTASGLVVTPLAPHGGCCPPLVVGPQTRISVDVEGGHGGARAELDGQVTGLEPRRLDVTWRPDHATLVELDHAEPFLSGLRRRRIIMDSPRVLARDEREPGAPG
ncbi:MAG TPA: NAD(+)/NADH kinase [Baekduia sp.]|nr:NAD(+)/NADH kinase [Baekduia sp.]